MFSTSFTPAVDAAMTVKTDDVISLLAGGRGPKSRLYRCEGPMLYSRASSNATFMKQQRDIDDLELPIYDELESRAIPLLYSSEAMATTTSSFVLTTNATSQSMMATTSSEWILLNPTGHSGYSAGTKEILYISLYCFFFLLAVLGNAMVIFTLARNSSTLTVTNCFLISLSVSDLMLALVCMPITLTGRILKEFIFGLEMCRLFMYLMGVSVAVSTFTMLAISVERYFAICNPLKSRGWQTSSHACKVICVIWIISFVLMSPYPIMSKLREFPAPPKGKCSHACRLVMKEPLNKIWYTLVMAVLFVGPGILMTLSYIKVCYAIFKGLELHDKKGNGKMWKGSRTKSTTGANGREMEEKNLLKDNQNSLMPPNGSSSRRSVDQDSRKTNSPSQLKLRNRVVFMLILIVVLFFICWTPLFFVNVWRAYDERRAIRAMEGSIEIIQLMSYVSTSINPVIYCFMQEKFREALIHAFLCCLPDSCKRRVAKQRTMATNFHSENQTQQMSLSVTPRPQRSHTSAV